MCRELFAIYERLLITYGPQGWWPGEGPFEVIVGAILTQRVSWTNVEQAIAALKQADLMDPRRLDAAPLEAVAALIQPCLYYNAKARKLKAFVRFLAQHHGGRLEPLLQLPLPTLREALLSIHGIGEETADAILLYAAGKPSFVVDAYTRRILSRLGLIPETAGYERVRRLFMDALPRDVALYQEVHALLVRHGKERCKSCRPLCEGCPLCPTCALAKETRAR